MKKKSGSKKRRKPVPRKSLSIRESRFLQAYGQARSLADAAIMAGYSPKYASDSGRQALRQISEKVPDILVRIGMDPETMIRKHLVPLLNATTVKLFQHDGKITDYAVVQDNSAQNTAFDTYAKMAGVYAPKEQVIREASTVRTIIMDVGNQRVSHSPDVATVKQLPPNALPPSNGNKK